MKILIYIPDWILLVLTGGLSLYLYLLPPLPNRIFLVSGNSDPINLEDSYPIRAEIISTWLSGAISAAAGVVVIGTAQIWVRNSKDFHRGILGLITALGMQSSKVVTAKILRDQE